MDGGHKNIKYQDKNIVYKVLVGKSEAKKSL
jgi:hypothetical protein